ncbi:hypothetical protein LDHU3_23.1780:CDS1 [Leishmania donovani]|nr:hypothetical protein LDHU3_23.1780:CDS1 [Leishmania donovani]
MGVCSCCLQLVRLLIVKKRQAVLSPTALSFSFSLHLLQCRATVYKGKQDTAIQMPAPSTVDDPTSSTHAFCIV